MRGTCLLLDPDWLCKHDVTLTECGRLSDWIASALRAQEYFEPARCSGCGARWFAPKESIFPGVVHLCGDCWRKVQGVLLQPRDRHVADSEHAE